MAFTGYNIFPGLTTIGVVNSAVQELAVNFNLEALNALSAPSPETAAWAEIAGVTPAIFRGKVPIDFTALDGFEPFKGVRTFKQVDVAAIQIDVVPWDRNIEWPIEWMMAGPDLQQILGGLSNKAANLVAHARIMKARLAATIFMQGTPSTNLAQVYLGNTIPGAGLSLFNTAHYANPLLPLAETRTFSNYHAAAGKLTPTTFGTTRTDMAQIPSPALSAETLGLQVTDVIGPTYMQEVFRNIALQNLYLQTTTSPGNLAAATTNIYVSGVTPCRFWIAPQLDADPYVAANPGKHMWIAVSRTLAGARPVEMVAPSTEFMPKLQLFGDGSEMAAMTQKIHLIGDLKAGAAAGLPHVCARYEET